MLGLLLSLIAGSAGCMQRKYCVNTLSLYHTKQWDVSSPKKFMNIVARVVSGRIHKLRSPKPGALSVFENHYWPFPPHMDLYSASRFQSIGSVLFVIFLMMVCHWCRYLRGNFLTGTIPEELGNLSHLTVLYVTDDSAKIISHSFQCDWLVRSSVGFPLWQSSLCRQGMLLLFFVFIPILMLNQTRHTVQGCIQ